MKTLLLCCLFTLTFAFVIPNDTLQASFIPCSRVNCDCENIDAGILNIGWKPVCRKRQKTIVAACKVQGYWIPTTGNCDPDPYGPAAFPVNKSSETVRQQVETAIQTPQPMRLVFHLLPGFASAHDRTPGEDYFNEINNEFLFPSLALLNLYEAIKLMVQEGEVDLYLYAETVQKINALLNEAEEEINGSAIARGIGLKEMTQSMLDRLPPDLNSEEQSKTHARFSEDLSQWTVRIFEKFITAKELLYQAIETNTALLDLQAAKDLLEDLQKLGRANPWLEKYGQTIIANTTQVAPRLDRVIDYAWQRFDAEFERE